MKTQNSNEESRKSLVVTTSWDDGHVDDIKLADLLKQYGIAGTFYVSPDNIEFGEHQRLNKHQIRELAQSFEIGAHTQTHRHLTTLSDEDSMREISESKKSLEEITGKPIVSFCYPAGKYEPRHVLMVKNAGFRIARTVRRFIFQINNPLECDTSVHTYDHWSDIWSLLRYVRFNPIVFLKLYHRWDVQAIYMFNRLQKTGGVFHLWGHSWELAHHNGWERLEKVLTHIGNREGVLYVTNGDLV